MHSPMEIFLFFLKAIEDMHKLSLQKLLFLMIAMLGAYASLSLGGSFLFFGHVVAGAIWAIFHILIVFLQAFIFMMLTLVYLGLAHEGH